MITLANALFYLTCLPSRGAFAAALARPSKTQEGLLESILRRNRGSSFARLHDFRDPAAFRASVPVRAYEDFAPWIERVAQGEPRVLTTEPVRLLEPTGGSSSATKLIPYTRGLQRDFQRALGPWLGSLFEQDPVLLARRAYWSVTPLVDRPTRTPGGLPIGFEEDSHYLAPLARFLVDFVQAVPPEVKRLRDTEAFLTRTAEALARCRSLGLISVWSPSFLTLLLDRLEREPRELWPGLRWLSCWGDGAAAAQLDGLLARLPGVRVQTKGLLATEGVVTIPYGGQHLLALRSHYFEILTDTGEVLPVARWETGLEGSILLTTNGGLYRYRLGDRVRVTGPLRLAFLGKEGLVSDQHGEKLSEAFVRSCLEGFSGPFALLVYAEGGYALLVEGQLNFDLEERLRRSFHYDYCRRLGQLAPVRLVPVSDGWRQYVEGCRRRGQRMGDVKPVALDPRPGWLADF